MLTNSFPSDNFLQTIVIFISYLQTRKYDGADDFNKSSRDTVGQPSLQPNAGTPTDSSVTGSPDSTDYTSDEYLRLPDKISPSTQCPVPTRVIILHHTNKIRQMILISILMIFIVCLSRSIESLLPNIWA